MKILYFSWLRECIGISSEEYSTTASTVRDLILELSKIELRYEKAFLNLSEVKVAIDQELVNSLDESIIGAQEIAFFPPPKALEVVKISGMQSWSKNSNKLPDLPNPHFTSSKIVIILLFFDISQI